MKAKKQSKKKVCVKDYAEKHNPVLNRRNHRMSESYLYRLIREDIAGKREKPLWFKYVLEGEKDRIFVLVD